MHRYRFVLYRPFQLIPVLFGISVLSFGICVRLTWAFSSIRNATVRRRFGCFMVSPHNQCGEGGTVANEVGSG